MNIKPLADRVLILPAPVEEKTIGGIIIPDSAKEKPLRGEVIAVGNGTKDEEMILKAGDQVLYGKYAGTELDLDGTKYLIMANNPILSSCGDTKSLRHRLYALSTQCCWRNRGSATSSIMILSS